MHAQREIFDTWTGLRLTVGRHKREQQDACRAIITEPSDDAGADSWEAQEREQQDACRAVMTEPSDGKYRSARAKKLKWLVHILPQA